MKNQKVLIVGFIALMIAMIWHLNQKSRPRLGARLVQILGPKKFPWVGRSQIQGADK